MNYYRGHPQDEQGAGRNAGRNMNQTNQGGDPTLNPSINLNFHHSANAPNQQTPANFSNNIPQNIQNIQNTQNIHIQSISTQIKPEYDTLRQDPHQVPLTRQTSSSSLTSNSTKLSSKPKTQRRRHKNSHYGCKNCKQRRIKCDETLPECVNCVKLSHSKTSAGQSYPSCSYLLLNPDDVQRMVLLKEAEKSAAQYTPLQPRAQPNKNPSPSFRSYKPVPLFGNGEPLNQHTQKGVFELKVYPNKLPFFQQRFREFHEFAQKAKLDRRDLFHKQKQVDYLRVHLYKMLLQSSVADIYFQSILSFTCNYLKCKLNSQGRLDDEAVLAQFALKYFGNSIKCQKLLVSSLNKLTAYHFEYLTSSTMVLTWTSLFQETELYAYLSFVTGMVSIVTSGMAGMKRLKLDEENSIGLQVALDNIIQSFKSCFSPSYSHQFLEELLANLHSLDSEPRFKNSLHHKNLCRFLSKLIGDFDLGRFKLDKMSTYSPSFMYKLLTSWYSIIPSELFNLGWHLDGYPLFKRIIACYYLAVSLGLTAIFPEVTFFFGVEFMGISTINLQTLFSSAQPNYHLIYLSRMYNFFVKRRDILAEEILFKSLDPLKDPSIYETGVKLTDITEEHIVSFNEQYLKPENYPHSRSVAKLLDILHPSLLLPPAASHQRQDVLFVGFLDYEDDSFKQLFQHLSHDNFDLHTHLHDYNPVTGILARDYIPTIHQDLSHSLQYSNIATELNLEIVYRIRLTLLHSQN